MITIRCEHLLQLINSGAYLSRGERCIANNNAFMIGTIFASGWVATTNTICTIEVFPIMNLDTKMKDGQPHS
jgi:hypothetical protein